MTRLVVTMHLVMHLERGPELSILFFESMSPLSDAPTKVPRIVHFVF